MTGLLAIALLAPNAIQIFKPFIKKNNENKFRYYLKRKTNKLIKDGLLEEKTEKGRKILRLTKKGERQLVYYRIKEKKYNKWDGKWRLIIFDVWENARYKRDLLRKEIKDFGFIQLQRSVWIFPHDCEEFVELLKTDLSFGKNIRYMVVESLDYDQSLKKRFNLT